MDNEMIVDFINNVEPDFSYGTSDSMSRAMVESAENMALINEYIVESTYNVYTEAENDDDSDKKLGFFGKLKQRISAYFTIFMNIVKKFIAKIKGFFMTLKRKLTAAFAKGIKAIGNFINNRINNNRSKFDAKTEEDEIKIYEWNTEKYNSLLKFFDTYGDVGFMSYDADNAAESVNTSIEHIKQIFDEKFNIDKTDSVNSLLKEKTITFSPKTSLNFLKEEYKLNIDKKIDDMYNAIMKSCKKTIENLNKSEKSITRMLKSASRKGNKDDFDYLKENLKATNKAINAVNLLKYKASQKIASACLKYYKKLFSAVRGVFGGINIFGDSDDAVKVKGKKKIDESGIIDCIK